MSVTLQILFGSAILGLCSLVHLVLLFVAVHLLQRMGRRLDRSRKTSHLGVLTTLAFAFVVLAHTAQVWIWAGAFVGLKALPDIGEAIYFALVTYTTLGYGDVTVADDFRVFAAMAAVTGLLNFGLSTAFLVGLLARLLPRHIE